MFFTTDHNTVGLIDPSGNVAALAGRTDEPGDDDGTGTNAHFGRAGTLALDPAGNAYVGDGTRIRKVGRDGTVTTIADAAQAQGAQPGFVAPAFPPIGGLAWRDGSLYATLLNAVIRITP